MGAQRGVPLFVLGGGSNLLVADAGFAGLVLHVGLKGIERDGDLFRVGAGEDWEHCVEQTLESELCWVGVSGRDSGDSGRNAGAECGRVRAGGCIGHRAGSGLRSGDAGVHRVSKCRVRICVSPQPVQLDGSGTVRRDARGLPAHARRRAHAALRGVAAGDGSERCGGGGQCGEPGLKEVAAAVRQIRRSKGMLLVDGDPDCRSAGSFFKNPVVSEELFQEIAARSARKSRRAFRPGQALRMRAA